MATTSGAGTSTRSTTRPPVHKPSPSKKDDNKKTLRKRVFGYLLVISLMLSAFYAYQNFQMAQIRNSLEQQISDAENANSLDHIALTDTLAKIRKQHPAADSFSKDSAFSKAPLSGRLEMRTSQIISEGEKDIQKTRERTPFIFITDVLMPGAQQSTDDHYRESIKAHVTSAEYLTFNKTKLQVDDLMSGIKYCRGEATELFYGYTDPEPDEATKQARAKAIQGAAKRHLCPQKG